MKKALLALGLGLILPVCGRANVALADEDLPPGTATSEILVKPSNPGFAVLLQLKGSSVIESIPGTSWYRVHVPSGYTAASFTSHLKGLSWVDDAAPDLGLTTVEGQGSTIPAGGTLLASQIPDQSEIDRIGGSVARSRATGVDVRVAVLDTGILAELEGVSGHVDSGGYDFVDGDSDPTDETDDDDDDGDGYVDEEYGHGTFVASLILAVAPDAMILPIRVLDADGRGKAAGVASAITYAVTQGVQVINLSVSVTATAGVVADAISYARSQGIEVVAAAGNSGQQTATLPCATQGALIVAAVDADDVRADFASYGDAVDMTAPGVDISGAYPASPGTAIWSGSSFSTALVTGGFALLRELHPSWTIDQISAKLTSTSASTSSANPGLDGLLGAGRLDLDEATAPE